VSTEELQRARLDKSIKRKLDGNPLQDVMLLLVDFLETDSQESQTSEKEKRSTTSRLVYNASSQSLPDNQTSSSAEPPTSTPYTQPRLLLSYQTPDNKRKISETSFGTCSTETTPNKLMHPEAKVQSLQNKFVDAIINRLWWGQIDIGWAKGRHMFLTYAG